MRFAVSGEWMRLAKKPNDLKKIGIGFVTEIFDQDGILVKYTTTCIHMLAPGSLWEGASGGANWKEMLHSSKNLILPPSSHSEHTIVRF